MTTGQVILGPGSAEVVAGDLALAGQMIDLDTALLRLHPGDRGSVVPKIARMAQTCGAILAESRVQAPDGSVRWLVDRGRVSRQSDGTVHGRGIWLDVTDIRQDVAVCDDWLVDHPLEVAAEHGIKARELLQQSQNSMLRLLLDMTVLELGGDNAGRTHGNGGQRPH